MTTNPANPINPANPAALPPRAGAHLLRVVIYALALLVVIALVIWRFMGSGPSAGDRAAQARAAALQREASQIQPPPSVPDAAPANPPEPSRRPVSGK